MKTFTKLLFIIGLSIITACSEDANFTEIEDLSLIDIVITIDENPEQGQVLGSVENVENLNGITFQLISQTPENAFGIDLENGTFYVNDETLFDFEERQVLTAIVSASLGDRSSESTITVNLNDVDENTISLQLFGSDREYETVLRVDFYNNGDVIETELANTVNDAEGIALYANNRLYYGSTSNTSEVDVHSVNTDGTGLQSYRVSEQDYLFSAVASDQTQQMTYYFLEGGNLDVLDHHRLFKMNSDGTNQELLVQTSFGTRANAVKKIIIDENNSSGTNNERTPFLYMHDRHSIFAYDPNNDDNLEDTAIFSSNQYDIVDMDIDFNTGMVYMVLSYFSGVDKHYIIATTNLTGSETNFNAGTVAENDPVTSIFYPHRVKLDIEHQQVYWFIETEDLQQSILKRSNFDGSEVTTIWETNTCLCVGELEDIRIEDYTIFIP